MAKRSRLYLRAFSLTVVLAACTLAGFGLVLWSDPEPAIVELRGKPLAVVRSDPFGFDGKLQEGYQVTTTGGLEFELLVIRPDRRGPLPLVLVALGSLNALEAASLVPEVPTCAFALIGSEFAGAPQAGLFGLRRTSDRATANFLAAWDQLRDQVWLDPAHVQVVGSAQTVSAAFLARELEGSFEQAWMLEPVPESARGLRDRLAHQLAFFGSRRPKAERLQAGAGEPKGLAGIAEHIHGRTGSEPPTSDPPALQPEPR